MGKRVHSLFSLGKRNKRNFVRKLWVNKDGNMMDQAGEEGMEGKNSKRDSWKDRVPFKVR